MPIKILKDFFGEISFFANFSKNFGFRQFFASDLSYVPIRDFVHLAKKISGTNIYIV